MNEERIAAEQQHEEARRRRSRRRRRREQEQTPDEPIGSNDTRGQGMNSSAQSHQDAPPPAEIIPEPLSQRQAWIRRISGMPRPPGAWVS
ncbi:hypothetical protein MMC12_003691 [Toensbergia leucococca]|nr:hypothetical protein [Toensbergia leucococca]